MEENKGFAKWLFTRIHFWAFVIVLTFVFYNDNIIQGGDVLLITFVMTFVLVGVIYAIIYYAGKGIRKLRNSKK